MASVMSYRPASNRRPSATSTASLHPAQAEAQNTLDNMPSAIRIPRPDEMSDLNGGQARRSSIKKTKRVRPQYPLDTADKHVEYILVASFDIDRGSIMEHQHPTPIGGDEAMLAELMLPDGAHMRKEDWTMFFLHKDSTTEQSPKKVGDDEEDDDDPVEGPPLVYVLNLVTTKSDSTAKRGAVCKAMAICTRHPFLHIYKPLLLLALEDYFRAPVPETLASLYNAVNAMDLSLMPRLTHTERLIMQASSFKDLFVEKFEALIQQSIAASGSPNTSAQGRARLAVPRDTHDFESIVPYNGIPVPVKIPTALTLETVGEFSLVTLVQTFNTPHTTSPQPFQNTHPHLTTSGPSTHPIIVLLNALLTQKRVMIIGHNLPSSQVAEAVLAACSLASGGSLRGFVRHAFPYTDLTKVDELLKVPGFVAGVTNPTFSMHSEWWDVLCDLQTGRMQISPKIEPAQSSDGVAFFQPSSAGAVMLQNAGINVSSLSSLDVTGDNAFMAGIIAAIAERQGESVVRARFRQWINKFTRLAAAFEEVVYSTNSLNASAPSADSSPTTPSSTRSFAGLTSNSARAQLVKGNGYVWSSQVEKLRELAANANRIEGWMKTRSYVNFIHDVEILHARRAVKDVDLQHLHDKLTRLRLGADASGFIYLAICDAVCTDAQIGELLVTVVTSAPNTTVAVTSPTSAGPTSTAPSGPTGLFHLALGLLHPRVEVREAVAELLANIRDHDAGRHFWNRMGGFEKAAWARVDAAIREKSAL